MKRKQPLHSPSLTVIPAKAGIHSSLRLARIQKLGRVPACAGMTPNGIELGTIGYFSIFGLERPR
jgi:hypothetical protein